MIAWGLIPARGGSKSIPYKNLVPIAGRPMIDWGIAAAQASQALARLVCSTEDERIASHVRQLGVEVDRRPDFLAQDDSAVADVARDFLQRSEAEGRGRPDILVLVQPTSPMLRPEHVAGLLDVFRRHPQARSAHNVTRAPHNHHLWNTRFLEDERIVFPFRKERSQAYNKQRKPLAFFFGNLIAARSDAILAGDGFFAEPAFGIEISRPYDLDVDGPEDLVVAEALLLGSRGVVERSA